MLSTKLLSLVLGEDVLNISIECNYNHIRVFYDKGGEDLNLDTLGRLLIEWFNKMGNSPEMLSSHKLFYITTDGRDWYSGYAHSKTTYDDKQTVDDKAKGDTMLECLINHAEWVAKGLLDV